MKPEEKRDPSFLEAAGELAEVAIDALTKNDAVAAIPVFGTAVRVLQGVDDVRSRAFAAKLQRFVAGIERERSKEKMKKKAASSPEEGRKVGETLFLVLERITDLDKPELLAKLFVAYLDDVITSVELRRLSQALDLAFVEDIKELVGSDDIHHLHRREWKEYLVASGLTRVEAEGGTIGGHPRAYYVVSSLGELMRRALSNTSK